MKVTKKDQNETNNHLKTDVTPNKLSNNYRWLCYLGAVRGPGVTVPPHPSTCGCRRHFVVLYVMRYKRKQKNYLSYFYVFVASRSSFNTSVKTPHIYLQIYLFGIWSAYNRHTVNRIIDRCCFTSCFAAQMSTLAFVSLSHSGCVTPHYLAACYSEQRSLTYKIIGGVCMLFSKDNIHSCTDSITLKCSKNRFVILIAHDVTFSRLRH